MQLLNQCGQLVDAALAGTAGTWDPKQWQTARTAWDAATEAVDAQLNQLQAGFRTSGHPTLLRVAEFGLNGITGKLKVGLRTAMLEFEQAGEDKRAAAARKLAATVTSFKGFVSSDEAIQLLDENPLNVAVTIRQSLGRALDQLEKSLTAAS
jgi:hypothetical protein